MKVIHLPTSCILSYYIESNREQGRFYVRNRYDLTTPLSGRFSTTRLYCRKSQLLNHNCQFPSPHCRYCTWCQPQEEAGWQQKRQRHAQQSTVVFYYLPSFLYYFFFLIVLLIMLLTSSSHLSIILDYIYYKYQFCFRTD